MTTNIQLPKSFIYNGWCYSITVEINGKNAQLSADQQEELFAKVDALTKTHIAHASLQQKQTSLQPITLTSENCRIGEINTPVKHKEISFNDQLASTITTLFSKEATSNLAQQLQKAGIVQNKTAQPLWPHLPRPVDPKTLQIDPRKDLGKDFRAEMEKQGVSLEGLEEADECSVDDNAESIVLQAFCANPRLFNACNALSLDLTSSEKQKAVLTAFFAKIENPLTIPPILILKTLMEKLNLNPNFPKNKPHAKTALTLALARRIEKHYLNLIAQSQDEDILSQGNFLLCAFNVQKFKLCQGEDLSINNPKQELEKLRGNFV